MSVVIVDQGRNNSVSLDPLVLQTGSGTVVLQGDDNVVVIEAGCVMTNGSIKLGSRCSLHVAARVRLAQIEVFAARDGHIVIGQQTGFTSHTRIFLHEGGRISIGQRCLIASGTLLTVSDMHTILDADTGIRINPPQDIDIGDGVWLGAEVAVMKGVTVGVGAIIGFRSVLTGAIPPYCLAIGMPARVIRERVTWRHELV